MTVLSAVLFVAAAALPLYLVTLAIYRLYFHPLAKFPGPKLTAVTSFYEFYYDVLKRGKFMWQIEAMHAKYGIISTPSQSWMISALCWTES